MWLPLLLALPSSLNELLKDGPCYNWTIERYTDNLGEHSKTNLSPEENSWSNPADFPEFAGDKLVSNTEKLQKLLDRSGFSELRKDRDEFNQFLEKSNKSDLHRYLSRINQSLREATVTERGFHEGRMFVGGMISPDRNTQIDILDDTIDAISQISDDKKSIRTSLLSAQLVASFYRCKRSYIARSLHNIASTGFRFKSERRFYYSRK